MMAQSAKKKRDNSATANPAFKDGGAIQCQLCGSENIAKDCPLFKQASQNAALKRGSLLPGQSEKERKQKGVKEDSDDEQHGEVCLICSKFNLCSPKLARTHTTQDCGRVHNNVKKELLKSMEVNSDAQDQSRRDKAKSRQKSVGTEQSYEQTSMMQNPYLDSSQSGSRQFYGSPYQMQNQTWHQTMQQQHMRPEFQQMYGQYLSGGNPQNSRSANMSSSVSSQGSVPGMMHTMESSSPGLINSGRESFDPKSANTAMTPSIMGMGGEPIDTSGARTLTSMLRQGNYLSDAQDERIRQATAMSASISNQQHRFAMVATIVKEHTQDESMLAQTGGNDHNSQKFFAQTKPKISETSTQTEVQIEQGSVYVQQITQTWGGSMEGQEHTSAKCKIEAVQTTVKSIEMESYANMMWQDLQQLSDQDHFEGGQEPTLNIAYNIQSKTETNNVKKSEIDDQACQFIESVNADTDEVLQSQPQKQPCSKTDDSMTKMEIKTTAIGDDEGLQERNLNKSTTESEYAVYDSGWKHYMGNQTEEPTPEAPSITLDIKDTGQLVVENHIPELVSPGVSPEMLYTEDYENLPELFDEISEFELGEEILKSNLMCYFDYQSAPNGPMKEKVQHWQEQMTPMHIVCESSKLVESPEDQDHNFRHGAMIEPRQPDSRK